MKTLSIFTLIKPATELPPGSSFTDLCCFSVGWPPPEIFIVWLMIINGPVTHRKLFTSFLAHPQSGIIALLCFARTNAHESHLWSPYKINDKSSEYINRIYCFSQTQPALWITCQWLRIFALHKNLAKLRAYCCSSLINAVIEKAMKCYICSNPGQSLAA